MSEIKDKLVTVESLDYVHDSLKNDINNLKDEIDAKLVNIETVTIGQNLKGKTVKFTLADVYNSAFSGVDTQLFYIDDNNKIEVTESGATGHYYAYTDVYFGGESMGDYDMRSGSITYTFPDDVDAIVIKHNTEYITAKIEYTVGKSPYAYAQEGGYTGTEEEFSKKLASGSLQVEFVSTGITDDESGFLLFSATKSVSECIKAFENGVPVYGTLDPTGSAFSGVMITCYEGTAVFEVSSVLNIAMRYMILGMSDGENDTWLGTYSDGATMADIPVPTIKTTTSITPIEVKALMDEGKAFAISHIDGAYGEMLFNSFVYSQAVGILSSIVFETGGVKFCAQLIGNLFSNDWSFKAIQLAGKDDIPPAAFYITLNSLDMTVDKSDEEIEAAYQAGCSIFCLFPQAGASIACPLVIRHSESQWVFSMVGLVVGATNALAGYLVISGGKCIANNLKTLANSDDTLPNPNPLTINGTTYDGSEAVSVGNTIHYIVGDSTTAGTWTGTCAEITKYYDGLVILYKLNVAGISGGSTLNINNLGTKPVYRNATTAVTATYAVGSVLLLTYSGGAWLIADYDANTKTSAASSNKTGTKMYLVAATSQNSSGVTTYSNTNCYIGTDNRLYSGGAVVPNTDEIKALIDEKLGVIENGSY